MRNVLISSICLLLLTACQSSSVTIDYDTEANFAEFQYYDWLEERSGAEEEFDPLIAERTKTAVAAELDNAAFKPASAANKANVLVRYYIATHTRNEESKSSGSIGFGSGSRGSAVGIGLSFPLGGSTTVKEAQIIVDLLSSEDQKLKWRGSNRLKISDESPEQITALINAAVAEIFSFYPPGAAPQ